MGEKAGRNEVINKLASVLEDSSDNVRCCAYEALEKMGEKAATNEVITKLVSALVDPCDGVKQSACSALAGMGRKAMTKEVISKLVVLLNSSGSNFVVIRVLQKIWNSSDAIIWLDSEVVLSLCLCRHASDVLKNNSEEQIVKSLFTVKGSACVPAITQLTLSRGIAMTVAKDKVVVYGSKEPVEIDIPNAQMCQQLVKAFTDQGNRLHLYFETSE